MLRASAESVLFTSLYGGCAASSASNGVASDVITPAIASVLEVDGVRILLDCGLDFSASPEQTGWYLTQLLTQLPTIDCVLLSSPETLYCGALPFVLQHLRRGVPVVAPSALCKIATHNVLGNFMARYANEAEFQVGPSKMMYRMTNNDIFNAFRAVKEPYGNRTVLRRFEDGSQATSRRGDADATHSNATLGGTINASDFEGIYEGENGQDGTEGQHADDDQMSSIVAEPIGNYRIIGGFMWRLKYQTDDILYCPDYSLHPSALLRRTALPTRSTMAIFGLPSGFATESASSSKVLSTVAASHRSLFDEHMPNLMRSIVDTFRREKDVLMPVTLSGRGLEMLMMLKHALQEKGVTSFNIVMVHYQAKELLARLKTMTALLQDTFVYESNDEFAEVRTCKSAEELAQVPSPRLILADGLTLEDNLAPEILLPFLSAAGNLVVAVDVPSAVTSATTEAATNIERLVDAAKSSSLTSFQWQYLRRTKLNKIELEHYYLAQEQALELREQQERQHEADLRRTAVAFAEDLREGVTDARRWDSDEDDDDATAAGSVGGAASHRSANPDAAPATLLPAGLYVPAKTAEALKRSAPVGKPAGGASQGIVGVSALLSRGIAFPQLDTFTSLATYLAMPNPTNEDRGYGIPLTSAEVSHLKRAAPHRVINDDAPLDLVLSVNEAQTEANIPCKVVWETVHCPRVQATVIPFPWILYEGQLDVASMKQLLLSQLASTVKKIVPIRASPADVRGLVAFCAEEASTFRAAALAQRAAAATTPALNDASPSSPHQQQQLIVSIEQQSAVQLAVAVFAFTVDLDPRFASHLQSTLRPVRETRSAGYWEVGHVNGVLDSRVNVQGFDDDGAEGALHVKKRRRVEGGAPILTFASHHSDVRKPTNDDNDVADDDDDTSVPLGSVYVGSLELPVVRDRLRQQLRQRVDVVRGLLTLEEAGACVRRSPSGDVTLSCIVGASMFDIREAIYAQYQHNL